MKSAPAAKMKSSPKLLLPLGGMLAFTIWILRSWRLMYRVAPELRDSEESTEIVFGDEVADGLMVNLILAWLAVAVVWSMVVLRIAGTGVPVVGAALNLAVLAALVRHNSRQQRSSYTGRFRLDHRAAMTGALAAVKPAQTT